MEPELAGALAGATTGGAVAAASHFVLDRRREHEAARSVARMVGIELDRIAKYVDASIADRAPWSGGELELRTWTEYAHLIAGELAEEELLALNEAASWISAANGWRNARGSGRIREAVLGGRRPFTEEDEQFLRLVLAAIGIARDSIRPLRAGRRTFVWRRRIPEAFAPDPRALCRCGHAFGAHALETRRRLFRLYRPQVPHEERASRCGECNCGSYRYANDGLVAHVLRQLRVMPQAPLSIG